jgi:PKHD-type hydroxylase
MEPINKINYAFQEFDPISYVAIGAGGIFTKEECEKIIKLGQDSFTQSKTEDDGSNNIVESYRKSEHFAIEVTDDTRWIFERLEGVIKQLNSQYFNFNISGFHESLQLTKYEVGGKYNKHMDSGCNTFLPRKLSAVVQLSNPDEYEGGGLEVFSSQEPIESKKDQGSIIIFPSFMMHKVKEVTKGTRYSLVSWIGGPQFR